MLNAQLHNYSESRKTWTSRLLSQPWGWLQINAIHEEIWSKWNKKKTLAHTLISEYDQKSISNENKLENAKQLSCRRFVFLYIFFCCCCYSLAVCFLLVIIPFHQFQCNSIKIKWNNHILKDIWTILQIQFLVILKLVPFYWCCKQWFFRLSLTVESQTQEEER